LTKVLVTGGAGFIGCNLADRLLSQGQEVVIFDSLCRRGTPHNVAWLQERHGADAFRLVQADLRDYEALLEATQRATLVYHLAGQTTVTTSVTDPRDDFEANALGTFNALEAARHAGNDPVFLFSSTNKVYGAMEDLAVVEEPTRYRYRDLPQGIAETRPLDFHSPYGCSKGAGDQYVRDYARIYGLRTVVLRQSCIYGPRQMGMEDQGWLAWFAIAAVSGRPITIYGDGRQVRDILYIDDLLDVFQAAVEHIDTTTGQVYNIGGGGGQTISVWVEFGPMLEELLGRRIAVSYSDWRPGDQKVYISDIQKARDELGWSPRVGVAEGVRRLVDWILQNRGLFED
jgi:CDP-paratose 2-epimerase